MRNLKKVLAAIVIVTMIMSTMMVSVFAADEQATEKTAGQICAELGVLKGGSTGVDAQYLATPTQRIQAAIIYLRMLGLEDEARAYEGTANFTDASLVAGIPGATNILAYLKANPELGWVGDGKKFSPVEQVSAQQMYKVLLTVLGYAQDTDFDYSETLFFAKFVGMKDVAGVARLKNADLATSIIEALKCNLKGGGPADTLIAQLVNSGRISAAVAEANGFDVNVLKIVSVAAPAAKEVEFGTTDPNLPATVKATLSDNSVMDADVVWDMTGYNATKPGKVTLKGAIEGFAAGVTIDITVKALVLDVASIDVPNARQIVVNYNGVIPGDAVKDKTKYTINGINPMNAELSADGKSVTLTTSYANRMANYSTNNKLVISKDVGFSADKTVENLVCRDTAVPTMVSAEATGPRTIKVTFSEPLDETVSALNTAASFSLDDGKVGLDGSNASYSANATVITLNTLADLTEGTHTIKVTGSNLKDGAAYPVVSNTISFDYAKDTSALTATVTEAKENVIKIKFNKALKTGSFAGNANVKLTHTYNTTLNEVTGAAATTTDQQEFTVTFSRPLPPGTSTVWLYYPEGTADANKIQDGYGNIFAATSFQVNVTADTTAPTVNAEFTDANHIKVTFSEDVIMDGGANAANNPANYTLKNGTDTISVIAAIRDAGTSTKVVNLTTGTINGGSLTLTVKNVKDISVAGNKIADTTLTIAATDKVLPTLAHDADAAISNLVQISATKVRVNYSEAMDVASVTDKSNYKINGADLNADDKITAVNSNKSVVIEFKTAPTVGWTLTVGRVKDVAGNYAAWLSTAIGTISGTYATIPVASAEMTGASKVKLTINDQITSVGTVADYVYSVDGVNFYSITGIASATVDSANNKSYIELNIGADIGNDTDLTNPVYIATTDGTTVGNASANVKNAEGQTFAMRTSVADKVAPKYLSVAVSRTDNSTGKHYLKDVTLTFSEALYAASIQESDFTVAGFEIESLSYTTGSSTVVITLKNKDNSDTEKPKVTLVGSVEDTQRNALNGSVEQTCP